MSFIPHDNMYRYNAPFVPANIDSNKMSSLVQRARFLQSQGATEQSNLELVHIQHQLALMQSGTDSWYAAAAATPAAMFPPQLPTFENHATNQDHYVFLPHQLNALKSQIIAYKLLVKNAPLPPQLQRAVLAPSYSWLAQPLPPTIPVIPPNQYHPHWFPLTTSTPQHPPELETASDAASCLSEATSSQSDLFSPPPAVAHQFGAYMPPAAFSASSIASYAHASSHQTNLIPSLLSAGIDPQAIQSDREKRMLACIKHQPQQSFTNLQDHIQSKALKLYQKQSQLRSELVRGVDTSTVLATSTHRAAFRRAKKVSRHDSRQAETVEQQQQRRRQESIQTAKHSRLNTICQHGSALTHEGKLKSAKFTKLGLAVVRYHQNTEKAGQKKMERIARARMRALKKDDEEAYTKLLGQTKNARLADLLKQTDAFLQPLTKPAVDQQPSTSNAAAYFRTTHRIHENVSQPAIMSGGQLKQYQIRGLQWMISLYNNHLNGILADETGLGKTVQAISLITYLIEKKQQHGPFLIVAPLPALESWTMEFDKWAPSVSKLVYTGPLHTRKELAGMVHSGQFQVLLTTFDCIARDTQALCRTDWLYLIMDDDHHTTNASAKHTVTLRQKFRAHYRLMLTGTPLQNNLPGLWASLNFVLPNIFKSVQTFEEWFNAPFFNQGVQDKADLSPQEQLLIITQLRKMLRPFLLRRLASDVESELPYKVEGMIKCRMSSLQIRLYQQLKHTSAVYMSSHTSSTIAAKGLNNAIMQLCKVCNHPFVFEGVANALHSSDTPSDLLYRCSGKFELLDRMLPKLQRTGHHVLIIFHMADTMHIMQDYLNWRNYRHLRLDDSTQPEDRSTLLSHLNQPDSPYFILLLSSARVDGLDLGLQAADTVILFDADWSPHQDVQAQACARRISQNKQARIFRLVTFNSIEERISAALAQYKRDNRSTEALLRTLLENTSAEEDQEVAYDQDANNQKLNDMLKRSDQELGVFEMMDSEQRAQEMSSKQRERLIQEHELADVFNEIDRVIVDSSAVVFDFDRSRKAKQNIKYDDRLTDAQFMRVIGEDVPRTEKKRPLPAATKPSSSSRKRLRAVAEKVPDVDSVSRLMRKQLTEIFEACYNRVEKSVASEDDEYYRKRCELFMDLVDKTDYPDYYTLIENPISMNMIKKRIHSFYYANIHEFKSDFALMFENARIFNEEESAVYEDANEMEKMLNSELERQCPLGILPKYHKRKTAIEQDFVEDPFDDEEDKEEEGDE